MIALLNALYLEEVRKRGKNKIGKYKESRQRQGMGGGVSLIEIAFECAPSSGNTGAHRSGRVK